MLERITKCAIRWKKVVSAANRRRSFMAHPDTLLPMPDIDDPLQRFVAVVKFYLSGWHIKPPYDTLGCDQENLTDPVLVVSRSH